MVKTLQNFNKADCIHFNWNRTKGCCGRTYRVGACLIPEEGKLTRPKTCNRNQYYCKYERKEETDNVHP